MPRRMQWSAALAVCALVSAMALAIPGYPEGAEERPRSRESARPLRPCVPTSTPADKAAVNAALIARIDAALAAAARYMVAKQSPDGAWRSEVYGCFRDGPTLTPYVMSSLFFLSHGDDDIAKAYRRGVEYLVRMVGPDGRIQPPPRGLNFPTYAAAMASRVVVLDEKTAERRRAQDAWLAMLLERRLSEALGWGPADPEFGGWGFSIDPPRKPSPGQLRGIFFESNLSATLFGVAALKSARVPAADPIYKEILVFVKRCQNFTDDPAASDARFDDGGFFFIPNDPLQNKAGVAGTDRHGRQRFHSYGTMTADGLRALIQCGLPPDHPRVLAARRWLERHFTPTTNPGTFNEDREVLRNATYYYYCWAVAHAFQHLGVRTVETPAGKVDWAEALADELLRRRLPDGTWTNRFTDAKEDDPLVSVPWAASALAICRRTLTESRPFPAAARQGATDTTGH